MVEAYAQIFLKFKSNKMFYFFSQSFEKINLMKLTELMAQQFIRSRRQFSSLENSVILSTCYNFY